ncbi:hypothetical protein OEB99_10130 [Actinotalea sp. M2MS4P-6]|uniref:hypothetical protein n=1 Tax=Actinotalea sp. M2MS4P-6 TaxID=2983762 RepID=UPI0021E38CEC|nr:hypothetical protein [Actinotalea sp. M2MS4P-6]MCV2394665.1 hypothetical protein [Actinotalea sp. M2MS4P-6]
MPEQDDGYTGHEWAIRVIAMRSVDAADLAGLNVSVGVGGLQIRDRVTGETGDFVVDGASIGATAIPGIGNGSVGNGDWATFRTVDAHRVEDFAGPAVIAEVDAVPLVDDMQSMTIRFSDDDWSTLGDLDVEHDGLWDTMWLGDAVEVGSTASSWNTSLGIGPVTLTLVDTHAGEPDPGLFEQPVETMAHGAAVVDHFNEGTTSDLEHAEREVDAQQSMPDDTDPAFDPEVMAHAAEMRLNDWAQAQADSEQCLDETLFDVDPADAAAEVDARQSLEPVDEPVTDDGPVSSLGDPALHEGLYDDIQEGLDGGGAADGVSAGDADDWSVAGDADDWSVAGDADDWSVAGDADDWSVAGDAPNLGADDTLDQ